MENKLYIVQQSDNDYTSLLYVFQSESDAIEVARAYEKIFPGERFDVITIEAESEKPWWVSSGMHLFHIDIDSSGDFIRDLMPIHTGIPKEGDFKIQWGYSRDREFIQIVRCQIWAESKRQALEIAKNKCAEMYVAGFLG